MSEETEPMTLKFNSGNVAVYHRKSGDLMTLWALKLHTEHELNTLAAERDAAIARAEAAEAAEAALRTDWYEALAQVETLREALSELVEAVNFINPQYGHPVGSELEAARSALASTEATAHEYEHALAMRVAERVAVTCLVGAGMTVAQAGELASALKTQIAEVVEEVLRRVR